MITVDLTDFPYTNFESFTVIEITQKMKLLPHTSTIWLLILVLMNYCAKRIGAEFNDCDCGSKFGETSMPDTHWGREPYKVYKIDCKCEDQFETGMPDVEW